MRYFKRFNTRVFWLLAWVFTQSLGSAFAAENNVVTGDLNSEKPEQDRGEAPAGQIGFYTYSYLYAPHSGRDANFFSLTGAYRAQSEGDILAAKADLQGVAIVKPATTWTIESPEIYVGTSKKLSDTVTVRVGRELKDWSHLDEDFQMGIWEPRFRWDYVHPETVGLAGFYVDVKTSDVQVSAFGTPLFVPDRGIPVEVRDQRLYSIDTYFNSPASTIPFRGVPTPVSYSIEKPSTATILMHPGGGFMVRKGGDRGFWASTAYAYKPMNQLLFSYSGLYNTAVNVQQIEATLYPRVAYHHVNSNEVGWASKHWVASLSNLQDIPEDHETVLGENNQVVTHSNALSPALEYRFGDLKYAPSRVRLSLLKQWGGNAPDNGPLVSGYSSVFEDRYFSHTALVLYGEAPLDFLAKHLSGTYRFTFDAQHQGTIQSTDLYYALNRTFLVNLGGDFLNSDEDPSAGDPISQYRANDRVRLGVSYVF